MLAHADKEGWVDIHPRAIAEEVGLTLEQVNAAIAELEAPDAESRSPEESGRRIVRLDEHRAWGWRVVNHAKYRAIRSEEDRREQNRLAQQRFREARKPQVSDSKQRKPPSAHTETETETETTTKSKTRAEDATASRLPADWVPTGADQDFCAATRPDLDCKAVADNFRDYWAAVPGAKGRKLDWSATWRNWVRNESRARAGPANQSLHDKRAATIQALTRPLHERPTSTERDITGECSRVA